MRHSGRARGPWLLSAVLLVPGAALPGAGADPPPDGGEVSAQQDPAAQSPASEPSAQEKPAEQKTADEKTADQKAPDEAADETAPTIACDAPGGKWHAANVVLHCTATDASPLRNSQDASFDLSTTVPSGTETASAATGSRQVCDVAGNCATAGPITGVRIDRKAPDIDVQVPADGGKYGLFTEQSVGYLCHDGGAGVRACRGDQAKGSRLKTGATTLGARSFTIVAVDKVGNKRKVVRKYSVEPVATPGPAGSPDAPKGDKPKSDKPKSDKPPTISPPLGIDPPGAKPPKD